MAAIIRTTHGTYTGHYVTAIIRREYGRDAFIHWSNDRTSPEKGMIVKHDKYGTQVLATLWDFFGTFNNPKTRNEYNVKAR